MNGTCGPACPQPFFLAAAPGQRYCVYHAAARAVQQRGAILYIHPFAEELNKSRRMAAVQARAFAAAGFHVLQLDLHGCGDSDGDFGEARWTTWRADLAAAWCWLSARTDGPSYLWGLRLGALLALDIAGGLAPAGLLLWQPVVDGRTHMKQFLRLQQAARLFGACPPALPADATPEVAGYSIAPELASAIAAASAPQRPPACPVWWLELAPAPVSAPGSPDPDPATGTASPPLQPASALTLTRWRAAGAGVHAQVHAQVLSGPAFWHSAEITEAPSLLACSLSLLRAATAGPSQEHP